MDIGQFIVGAAPVIVVGAALLFVVLSNPRQRIAVLLALAFPGLGHLWIKQRQRALLFMALIVPLFLAGMAMTDFCNISPLDRHPIWGIAQAPGGLMTALAALITSSFKIPPGTNPYYHIGCLYSGAACLMNVLAVCDVWDLCADEQQIKKREARAE